MHQGVQLRTNCPCPDQGFFPQKSQPSHLLGLPPPQGFFMERGLQASHLLWPFSFLSGHELGYNPHHPSPVQQITCHWDWLPQIPQGSATLLQPESPHSP